MAGGIDWFRWHHGSVTDPKFQLVAKKSNSRLSDVLAVWAYILEKASAAEFRSCFGEIDCESVDCLFGFDDGTTDAILMQMEERKLIVDEYIVNWDKRQPKREDETAAERKRRQREREHEMSMQTSVTEQQVTPCHADVTPCHADVTPCHDREEKRRVNNTTSNPDGFLVFWSAYPKKIGKGAAEKSWKKMKPPLDVVLRSIEIAADSDQWRKDGGQYIPNPATWLNQKRWEDETEEQPQKIAGGGTYYPGIGIVL